VTEDGEAAHPPARQEDAAGRGEIAAPGDDEDWPFAGSAWMAAQVRTGPLPEAAEFQKYEAVLPGAADRILRITERAMDLTEREAGHRHEVERSVVGANIKNQSRGQWIATFFGIVGFGAAIAFVVAGQNVAAFVAVLVPLGAFISRFIRRPNGPTG
jgi:uncharacterized membrane protein